MLTTGPNRAEKVLDYYDNDGAYQLLLLFFMVHGTYTLAVQLIAGSQSQMLPSVFVGCSLLRAPLARITSTQASICFSLSSM